jgi:hypothetical protein
MVKPNANMIGTVHPFAALPSRASACRCSVREIWIAQARQGAPRIHIDLAGLAPPKFFFRTYKIRPREPRRSTGRPTSASQG